MVKSLLRIHHSRNRYTDPNVEIKPITIPTLKEMIDGVILKAGLEMKRTGIRYDIQRWHGFRKRYNTILKSNSGINSNIAEKLMGHKNGLDGVYFVPTIEQLFTEFQKAIPELTVNETEQLKVRLEQSEKKQEELQVKEDRIAYLERIVFRLQNTKEKGCL